MLSSSLMTATTPLKDSWAFHAPSECTGRPCPVHRPSSHPLRDRPILMPLTPHDLVLERVCHHGIAHPDPDSVAQADIIDPTNEGAHGLHPPCCGCCRT